MVALMALPADYHMHTPLCRHATGEPIDLARHALKLGLTEIGFSEHAPMIRDDYDDWHMVRADLATYVEKVEAARRAHPTLTIRLGLEVDYLPGHEEWVRELAAKHPWDYLLGAVHYVTDWWDLDNPAKVGEWSKHDPYDIWTAYFDRLTRAAETGLFDIIAHADLCKKFRVYPRQDCTPLFGRFLRGMKDQGLALEINTAGLRKECREIYPRPRMLQMASQLGIPITFGSDAHAPGEVGADFSLAMQLARSARYTQSARFNQRQRELVALG
jgi:histidinol-phosphatase (PHP family)